LKKRTLTAITRAVSPSLADCELTFLARRKDDIRNIKQIHRIIKGGTVFDPAELPKQ